MKPNHRTTPLYLNTVAPELRPLILAVLLAALITTSVLAFMDVSRLFMLVLIGAFSLSVLLAFNGKTTLASWIALTSSLIILSILVYLNNGIRDTAMMGLIAVLIAAGLLAGKFGTLVIGCCLIVEIGIYGALETAGVLVNPFSRLNSFSDYFSISLSIALITALQWLVITRLNNSAQSAEMELAERKKYQVQLQEAEARYRGLVESIPLVIYTAEPGITGRWHFISPQIAQLTGFEPDEWINSPGLWFSRVHPDDRDRIMKAEAEATRENNIPELEYRFLTRAGTYIWISDRGLIRVKPGQPLIQGYLLDITDRKLAEEQLNKRIAELQAVHGISETLIRKSDLQKLIQETGDQIRMAFKANNVLIAIHDPNTNLIHFPYDYEDGKKRKDVPIRYGEGMTTQIMEMKKSVLIESGWMDRSKAMNAIYTNAMPVLSSFSTPIMTDEKVIGVITIESSEREYAFTETDVRPLLTIAANLAVAIEKTRLQDSIRQEMEIQDSLIRELELKNEELERFVYTASHDLKSPLITIRGFLGYLAQDARMGNFDQLNTDIQRITDATEKMQRLLGELLELSRVGRIASEKQDVPFDDIVAEALDRVEGQLTANQVRVKVGSGLPSVYVDKERVVEVVQNLVDNAIKFMGNQPEPMIEIGHVLEDERPIFFVRDNGIGIRKEFHKRIFGLFDKLNTATEGTGVGLALVKRIVEVHGGSIWVDSQEGAGATFSFTLQ
ncbi:MAG: PAS domain-containing protein [Anaerolineales bacterium]|nr:PAS domain-containing protein [Anaerolineales bacterium]